MRQLVFLRDQERKKGENCVRGSFVSGFKNGHMETTEQTVFFSVVMEYQRAFWEEMWFYIAEGQISWNQENKRAFTAM